MLAALIDVAANVGLPVVFILIAVETMGIPLPGETALITAGVLASKGKMSIEALCIVAALAAILGDNIGFYLGRRLGRRVLVADGPFKHHRTRAVELGEPFFAKHGPKAVFLGRWTAGLRICAAWLAGASGMKWRVFTFYNALGGILWATSIALLAYYLGHRAEKVVHAAGIGGLAFVVVGGVAAYAYVRIRRRRREAAEAATAADEPTLV